MLSQQGMQRLAVTVWFCCGEKQLILVKHSKDLYVHRIEILPRWLRP